MKNSLEVNFWLDNLRFTSTQMLKNQIMTIFIPFAKSKLSAEDTKYFIKRFYRKLSSVQGENGFSEFLEKDEVINYSRYQYDYDSWCEWMLLKFNSIEEAAKFVMDYNREWVGEIDFELRDYDCTGETFSDGMKFTKVAENIVFAYKRYNLDV